MNEFGIDLSRYDSPVNWQAFWQHNWGTPMAYIAHRATISWGYRDPWFASNAIEILSHDTPLFPYHVIYAGQPIQRQVENFMSACSDIDWDYPVWPVIDCELDFGLGKQAITDAILNWLSAVQSATGKRPIIYSRANWINDFTVNGAWRNSELWWLAQYLNTHVDEHPGPPTLPASVSTYLIHQTADRFPVPAGILARPYVDSNRWNANGPTVSEFFGEQQEEVSLPEWAEAITTWARDLGYNGPNYSE